MTCRDVMTSSPVCCVPSDTAQRAAQLMRNENVGSLPVISDQQSRHLVGMVTDRDLALGVLAENRNSATTIDQVMTRGITSCSPDDDYHRAIESMEKHQVRRVPIVNHDGSVVGIVAQADIATRVSDSEEVAEVVGEISQSGTENGRGAISSMGMNRDVWMDGMRDCMLVTSGIGVGAALMYFLDPGRGHRRRALARDQAVSLTKRSGKAIHKKQRDLTNRASGVLAKASALYSREEPDLDTLEDRVRSKIGHVLANSRSVEVHSSGGTVELQGSLPAEEVDNLISTVRSVRGVTNVVNRIDATFDRQTRNNTMPDRGEMGGALNLSEIASRGSLGKAVAGLASGLLSRTLTGRVKSAKVNR